jgi:hypothetical protein
MKEIILHDSPRKAGNYLSNNGNGRRSVFDPVIVLLRLFRSIWERQNIMTGESNIVDDEEAREELKDKLDPPDSQQDN